MVTRIAVSDPNSLAMDAPTEKSPPASRTRAASRYSRREASIPVAMSASMNCSAWFSMTGRPNCSRSRVNATEASRAAWARPTEQAAMPSRPPSSAARATLKPMPSSPTRFAAGTRHPSNRSSRMGEACQPILSSTLPNSNPSQPFSTTNAEIPAGVSSPVRAMTRYASASPAWLMNRFEPSSR